MKYTPFSVTIFGCLLAHRISLVFLVFVCLRSSNLTDRMRLYQLTRAVCLFSLREHRITFLSFIRHKGGRDQGKEGKMEPPLTVSKIRHRSGPNDLYVQASMYYL